MFKNYLLVTFRNLFKNRVFTLINIIGLGIALAVCIVAFFNHMFNYEFDRTHVNFDKIYRVTSFRDMQGREQEYGTVPATLGLEVKKDIPGVEKSARVIRGGYPVKIGNDLFPAQTSFVDPDFADIFTLNMLAGDIKSINNQGNVLVSDKMASTLFGKDYAVGKTIILISDQGKEYAFSVGGVFKEFPQNSSFRIDILCHIDNLLQIRNVNDADWKAMVSAFFVMIPEKSNVSSVAKSLKNYTDVQNRAREDFKINRFNLVPLDDVGENTRLIWSSGLFPSLHPAAIKAPPIMALFILLIACFNFANTSIATFSKRLKEIGLRKTFGGLRSQLVTQFMFETVIICTLALFAGIVIAEFLVPAYSSLWAYMSIKLTFTGYPFFWFFLVLLLLITGFVAGVYPALYVSSFNPVNVLKGASPFRGSGKLSAVLLTLQFSISVMALVMGIVFTKNAGYQKTLDLGYDKDMLMIVPVPQQYYSSMRNEILSNPKVISAEGTSSHLGYGSYRRPLKDADKQLEVDVLDIGYGYAQTVGIRLKEGRLYDESHSAADIKNNSIIVNRKLVKDFGWAEGVGHVLTLYDTIKLNIIGVVEDYYLNGVWSEIEPAVLRIVPKERFGIIAVRANTPDLPEVLDFADKKWKDMSTNLIFGGRLQEDLMQEEKDINGSIMKVNIFLALAATLLSLIGMYNMVSLDIIRRTKEVGVRKIQGATVPVIMYLVSRKFIVILVIASLAGCAGGYYLSLLLLDSIWDYFVNITFGILLSASLILFISTALTLGFRIYRAAMRNPVDSLRYE
jgi:putative ABC transport system permease protein